MVSINLAKHLKLYTYSYLDGSTLFHKIAVLCKKTRLALPNAGLLDQPKELTLKFRTR